MSHAANSDDAAGEPNPYGPTFWWCYAANCSLMIAVSLLFRYSDFVLRHLHAGEGWLGVIVGAGMVGAVAMRAVQGVAIDRYGAARVWLASQALLVTSSLAHLMIDTAYGPAIFFWRTVLTTGIAGSFGASLTFISLRVPQHRVPEMIGMLGSSGFVGLALGPILGDMLLGKENIAYADFVRMFVLAAAVGCVSMLCALMASRKTASRKLRRQPPPWRLLKRYHPGMLLAVSLAMGMGVGLPNVFVAAYAQEMRIDEIKWFFMTYAVVAFSVRLLTRRSVERWGVKRTVMLGFAFVCASMVAYLPVTTAIEFVLPAVLGGAGHAFLFPAIVGGGSTTFPERYRGLGTTLVLAMFDVGNLIGQPLAGGMVELARRLGLPPYASMFVAMACVLAALSSAYALSPGRQSYRHRRLQRRKAVTPTQSIEKEAA